jgi:glycine/D-amino acid oxidase-like deaminating enzyme
MANAPARNVVVIGGGIVGSSTAHFLKKRGADVTIIEGSSIAAGASGKAGGLLAYDWTEGQPSESLCVRTGAQPGIHSAVLHAEVRLLMLIDIHIVNAGRKSAISFIKI